MSRWKFQIMPNLPDIVGKRYRMDLVCDEVEAQVNEAMPFPLKFHGVVKVVVALGPDPHPVEDYRELLGVAKKQWPDFDLHGYAAMTDSVKRETLRAVVCATFNWFQQSHADAFFVVRARERIAWAT